MKTHLMMIAIALCAFAVTASAAEMEYGGIACGHSKRSVLVSSPELTVFTSEFWGIQTPESTFAPWKNADLRCMGHGRIENGKRSSKSTCVWTDAEGDTFIGEAQVTPGQPNTWTFLSGTGKWKGVQGRGTYKVVAVGKPFADGTGAVCISHMGTYTVPQ